MLAFVALEGWPGVFEQRQFTANDSTKSLVLYSTDHLVSAMTLYIADYELVLSINSQKRDIRSHSIDTDNDYVINIVGQVKWVTIFPVSYTFKMYLFTVLFFLTPHSHIPLPPILHCLCFALYFVRS